MEVMVIPIIICALGTIPKCLVKVQEKLEMGEQNPGLFKNVPGYAEGTE